MKSQKVCLITGANGLIGKGLQKSFHDHGYELILVDVDFSQQEPMPHCEYHTCDITDQDEVRDLFFDIRRVDVLINNAAISTPTNPPLEDMDLEQWNKVIETNLTGHFLMTKYALPFLKETKGAIINISSTRALMAEPFNEAYAACKGGILSFTTALSISYAQQVRANAISPGWIDSPEKEHTQKEKQQHPVGRVGRPEDVSSLALFLASDSAGFITGQNFVVDGGMTKKMIYHEGK